MSLPLESNEAKARTEIKDNLFRSQHSHCQTFTPRMSPQNLLNSPREPVHLSFILPVLVFCGGCNKLPHTSGFKQQKVIVSEFWKPEV